VAESSSSMVKLVTAILKPSNAELMKVVESCYGLLPLAYSHYSSAGGFFDKLERLVKANFISLAPGASRVFFLCALYTSNPLTTPMLAVANVIAGYISTVVVRPLPTLFLPPDFSAIVIGREV